MICRLKLTLSSLIKKECPFLIYQMILLLHRLWRFAYFWCYSLRLFKLHLCEVNGVFDLKQEEKKKGVSPLSKYVAILRQKAQQRNDSLVESRFVKCFIFFKYFLQQIYRIEFKLYSYLHIIYEIDLAYVFFQYNCG